MLTLHVALQRPLPCEDGMRLWSEILQVEDTLFRKIFNHYRPELHYMRGPGPKWLEKHSAVAECAMPQVSGSGGSNPSNGGRRRAVWLQGWFRQRCNKAAGRAAVCN